MQSVSSESDHPLEGDGLDVRDRPCPAESPSIQILARDSRPFVDAILHSDAHAASEMALHVAVQ
jgi:hypothetical protein